MRIAYDLRAYTYAYGDGPRLYNVYFLELFSPEHHGARHRFRGGLNGIPDVNENNYGRLRFVARNIVGANDDGDISVCSVLL